MNLEKKTVTREVEKTVVETVSENEFILTLSQDEATALVAVAGGIGGTVAENNPRDLMDSIYQELHGKVNNDDLKKYQNSIKDYMYVGKRQFRLL